MITIEPYSLTARAKAMAKPASAAGGVVGRTTGKKSASG